MAESTDRQRYRYKAVVVVFVDADGRDEHDASNVAQAAVLDRLVGDNPGATFPIGIPAPPLRENDDRTAYVAHVGTLRSAIDGGYVRTVPTSRAWTELDVEAPADEVSALRARVHELKEELASADDDAMYAERERAEIASLDDEGDER